ncbi:MAG TPA: hypothetical protein DEP84_25115, partial [Chloroflexi bacterium]|nr:hypothetical protein [Chloroflexota bacterium]
MLQIAGATLTAITPRAAHNWCMLYERGEPHPLVAETMLPHGSFTRRPVMVIGLDGLTLDLLLPMVATGALPTFGRLLQRGAFGMLRSVTNMSTGPTWATFATGCTPEHHGILHDFHHRPGSYTLRPTAGHDCQVARFWEVASEAGRTAIVLNVPHTYPARPLRGVQLCGIDAPSERAPGFDYPAGSYRALRRSGVDYIIDCGLASSMQAGNIAAGVAAVARETEGRTRAAEQFMAQMDWDLLVTVYSLPDLWQHYFWADLNTAPAGSAHQGRALIKDGYRTLDRHLARLLAHLPADGLVVICSDHGFGPLCSTRDSLNGWLAQQGLLRYKEGTRRALLARVGRTLFAHARRRVSFRFRQQLLASMPALRRAVETRLRIGGIDWAHTQVYAALDHQELWVNLRGRQPLGCVAPGDYDAVCERVTAALLAWRDEHSGGPPIVSAVPRRPSGETAPPGCL